MILQPYSSEKVAGPEKVEGSDALVMIVVPALNEELTIGQFVDWCWEGLQKAGVEGKILIVDSSTDRTAEIAESKGAQVLRVPKRGLGRAYIDAQPYISARYAILGDCDLTYDFRELQPFIERLQEGHDFVMGSRFKGYIEPGAMPFLHRYFGNPLTTWILNRIYGTGFSDIHCGMRGITSEALKRVKLESQSWEYASEMLLKVARLKLPSTEVPIRFYKDREGRLSHHKRVGWYSPWIAGWLNLKSIFLYAPDFFLFKPGWLLFCLGLFLTVSLTNGPYFIGHFGLNLYWMLLGLTMATLGYSAIQLGFLAKVYYNFDQRLTARIRRVITYDRGLLGGISLVFIGITLEVFLVAIWVEGGLRLNEIYYPGILGLLLIILGFQTFTFTLLLEMLFTKNERFENTEGKSN